jgi:hypothetical protein
MNEYFAGDETTLEQATNTHKIDGRTRENIQNMEKFQFLVSVVFFAAM